MPPEPYRSTPVFDEQTLPTALRNRHNTKAGVWGKIKIFKGELKLTYLDPASEVVLRAGEHGMVQPQQWHFVTPLGPIEMQVDFYNEVPPSA